MHAWNKKFFVSKIALACAVAVTAPAAMSADISGTVYDTFYSDSIQSGYIGYHGYVDNDGANNSYTGGDIYSSINNAVVNGVISTHYLGFDSNTSNVLNITNTTVNGMITSRCVGSTDSTCGSAARNEYDQSPLQLTIDNSTINDTYENFGYDVVGADNKITHQQYPTSALGVAVTLEQESNIVIQNNSHVAGIALTQGYGWADTTVNNGNTYDTNITVNDSVLTSGSYSELGNNSFYGQSDKPSDYGSRTGSTTNPDDDVALSVTATAQDNSMKTNAVFNNSTIKGDVTFASSFDNNYHERGIDSNGDGVKDTNGWDDTDELNLTLDNGSKWVGAATSTVAEDHELYDRSANSIWEKAVYNNTSGVLISDSVYQSGLFNVALNNGSEWDTTKVSSIDNLTLNNQSQLNVVDSTLVADNISLTNQSSLKIAAHGGVATDALNLNSGSKATLTEETASLYANTITVGNGSQLNLGAGEVDTHNMVLTDDGTFNVGSREYVLNSDMNNARDKTAADYVYDRGTIGMNSDGHLAVNGVTNGNYQVRIDNATGAGRVADYQNKELIRTYGGNAAFTHANTADLGAFKYQAEQVGDTVVLAKQGITSTANAALSLPSSNAATWHMEQDTLSNRMDSSRHTQGDDKGGVWVNYFGGQQNGDNGVVDYDQDVNGIMVGLDKVTEGGGDRQWLVGMAASFAKSSLSMDNASADTDSQSARVYSSLDFKNGVFIDSSLSYSHFNNSTDSTMSNGQQVSGDNSTDAWGFGLKAGYDWKFAPQAYLTPYASITGVFIGDDDYSMSNNMRVSDQAYDSMRYELGTNIGYTFDLGAGQAISPYATLAYVYEDANNDADINGDRIDNGIDGSAVRVGLGGQFDMSKNFTVYAGANYLGGSDVDQPWAANVGMKYRW